MITGQIPQEIIGHNQKLQKLTLCEEFVNCCQNATEIWENLHLNGFSGNKLT